MEKKELLKNHRLSTLQSVYLQWPEFRNLNSDKRCAADGENINFSLTTGSFLLNKFLRWLAKLDMTVDLLEIFCW